MIRRSPALALDRRGSAARVVLVLLAVLLVGLGALWWALRTPPGRPFAAEAGPRGPAPAPAPAPAVELASSERRATGVVESVTAQGGMIVPVGVRLDGDGRLGGRVLERESGGGVEGARVELFPLPPAGSALFDRVLRLAHLDDRAEAARAVAVVLSGADGAFEFRDVRAGSYFVEARGSVHVPEAPVRARVAPSGAGGPLDVWVRRGGRIVGRVERPDGSPAAGAGVSLRPGPEELLERARTGDVLLLDTEADADGRFVLHGVPAGGGWALAAYGRGFALSHVANLSVRAGADTEVVIRARAGATVDGRSVVGAGPEGAAPPGAPVAGAHVAAVPHGLRDLLFLEHLLESSYAVSGAEGAWRLEHVPPGETTLVGWAPGHLPSLGPTLFLDEGGAATAPDLELATGPVVAGRVVDGAGDPVPGATVRWTPIDFEGVALGGLTFGLAPYLAATIPGFVWPTTGADGGFVAGAFPGDPPYEITVEKAGWGDVEHRWNPAEEEPPIEIVLRRGGAVEGIVMDGARRAPLGSFTVSTQALSPLRLGEPGGDNPFSSGRLVEDPGGRFRIEPLQPGRTRLSVSAPGYVEGRSEELEIVEGEVVRGVIVTLQPGGTVRGRVVDASGAPVPGALVFWGEDAGWQRPSDTPRPDSRTPRASDMPAGMREYAAALGVLAGESTVSLPDGGFVLTGVQPGSIVVYAAHRSLASGSSAPVLVEAGGEVAGVEVELSAGARLHGTVSDRFGRAVPGVYVVAVSPAAMNDDANGAGGALYQGHSDEQGAYEITRMAGGGYFLTTTRGDAALNPMSFLGALNFELVTVPEGQEVEYDIVDRSIGGARVTGLVTERGEPVSGGQLVALGFESESLLGVDVKMTRIREDGSYEFEALAPGEYRFSIDVRGGPRGRPGGSGETRVSVEVPDLPEVRLDLALPEGEIAGVVLDATTGEPIESAQVALRALDAPVPSGLLGGLLAREGGERRWTDEDGAFRFARLESGAYRMEVSSPRWGERQGSWAAAEPLELELDWNERLDDLEVRLQPAVLLAGLVRDEDGRPIEGARVAAVRTDLETNARSAARTGEDGRFTLKGLAQGTWDLSASASGFAGASLRGLPLESHDPPEVELVLPRGIEVTLFVTDGAGRPLSGAAGRLVSADAGEASVGDAEELFGRFFSGQGTSGADGRLALGRYAPGRYRLEVQRGSSRAAPQEVELAGGGSVELRVRLP